MIFWINKKMGLYSKIQGQTAIFGFQAIYADPEL